MSSILDELGFGPPFEPQDPEDVKAGIKKARELEDRNPFLEGVAKRLTELGVECSPENTDLILAEVRARFRRVLGKTCPRTVAKWCNGKNTSGDKNRLNNYDLCWALEMDFRQTSEFFRENFLTLPFIVKARVDAVFMYCLYHKKPYPTAVSLLERAKGFVPQEEAGTATSQIASVILNTDDDEGFLHYLSAHCYSDEQQFLLAKDIIRSELEIMKETILKSSTRTHLDPDRLGSETIQTLLGFYYQREKRLEKGALPRHFTESLPNDSTLGQILNGEDVSYELLRKTLMLVRFYNFYSQADNSDPRTVHNNLLDFCEELNWDLNACGFAQLYSGHPFDCLLLYCANTHEPVDTLYLVMANGRNPS